MTPVLWPVSFMAVLLLIGVFCLLVDLRDRRVPSHVRVEQLRETFRQADPGEEVLIRPSASWVLSVEMIIEVAADEGFRFRGDGVMTLSGQSETAMAFTADPGMHGEWHEPD